MLLASTPFILVAIALVFRSVITPRGYDLRQYIWLGNNRNRIANLINTRCDLVYMSTMSQEALRLFRQCDKALKNSVLVYLLVI